MDYRASSKSSLEKARESIAHASAELSLLISASDKEFVAEAGSGATGSSETAEPVRPSGYRRLQECCAKAMASMLECLRRLTTGPNRPSHHDFVPLYSSARGRNERRGSLWDFIFVVFVGQLILLLYLTFVLLYMPVTHTLWSSPISLFFHLCMLLCNISYFRGCTTDPGGVPHTAEWIDGSAETHERKKQTGERRFCAKEHVFKPDRAHFCSLRCANTLRMDHYCPWLNNTIGFYNYKFFFLFVLYAAVLSDTMTSALLHVIWHHSRSMLTVFLWEATWLSALLGCVLTPFSLFHMWLVSRNMTTIELCEMRAANSEHRYDLGVCQNWRQIMGNPLTWLLPVGGPEGNGMQFPTNPRFEEKAPLAQEDQTPPGCAVALMMSWCENLTIGCEVIGSSFANSPFFKHCGSVQKTD